MVTDQTVLARIAATWPPEGLFDSGWANLVGGWCVSHIEQYNEPPNGKLPGIFEKWAAESAAPDETIESVERFLSFVSREHSQSDPVTPNYVLDEAGAYFNAVRLKAEIQEATDELEHGKVADAAARLGQIGHVELGNGSIIKPGEEFDIWQRAFEKSETRPLISYKGMLGDFLGDAFGRGEFVAIMAPDKVGKSWWLLDMAFRAARSRSRVAYIDCGDMTEDDVIQRLGQRASGLPSVPGEQAIPVGFDSGAVKTEQRTYDKACSAQSGFKAFNKAIKSKDRLRISCHPNSTLSVAGVESLVRDWTRDGWVPDVLVLDYADIMAASSGIRETQDQIDDTWRGLRRLSQRLHCLVITATQANAASYGERGKTLGRRNFSGRKTKLAHVTAMLGLNQTDEEKLAGIWRVNFVVRRRGRYTETAFVRVAGNLSVGRPTTISEDWGNS